MARVHKSISTASGEYTVRKGPKSHGVTEFIDAAQEKS